MRFSKTALMGGVAALALGISSVGVTTEAQAFDVVTWNWDLDVLETVDKQVTIDVTVNPIGDITDQIMQLHVGNIATYSSVNGVYNIPIRDKELKPVEGYKAEYVLDVDVDAKLDLEISEKGDRDDAAILQGYFVYGFGRLSSFRPSGGEIGGGFFEGRAFASIDADLDFELDITKTESLVIHGLRHVPLDAPTELPEVRSVATSVGNSINIESDTMVQEHSLQITSDSIWADRDLEFPPIFTDVDVSVNADYDLTLNGANVSTSNVFHNLAITRMLAANAGFIDKAQITSESYVDNIYNASVDSQATSAGNVKTITLDTDNAQNAVVLADITQVAIADLSATSIVGSPRRICREILCEQPSGLVNGLGGGITIYGYNNFGALDKPIVNSVATSIGNAVNITVKSGQGPSVLP